ncbi:hypothetical protein GmRootV59_54060 (plasmid) [Variovorax sp. V59]
MSTTISAGDEYTSDKGLRTIPVPSREDFPVGRMLTKEKPKPADTAERTVS